MSLRDDQSSMDFLFSSPWNTYYPNKKKPGTHFWKGESPLGHFSKIPLHLASNRYEGGGRGGGRSVFFARFVALPFFFFALSSSSSCLELPRPTDSTLTALGPRQRGRRESTRYHGFLLVLVSQICQVYNFLRGFYPTQETCLKLYLKP